MRAKHARASIVAITLAIAREGKTGVGEIPLFAGPTTIPCS